MYIYADINMYVHIFLIWNLAGTIITFIVPYDRMLYTNKLYIKKWIY